jgi:hypothetical protein
MISLIKQKPASLLGQMLHHQQLTKLAHRIFHAQHHCWTQSSHLGKHVQHHLQACMIVLRLSTTGHYTEIVQLLAMMSATHISALRAGMTYLDL